MNEQTSPENQAETPAQAATRPGKSRLFAIAMGLGGMIVGSLVGIGVQVGVESTGLLGPSVESLIEEQQHNFSEVNAQLDALKKLSSDKETQASLADLGKLLARQDQLAQQANAELAYMSEQLAEMKKQQLAESGYSGGADFWLKSGESVNVGGQQQVFGLLGARSTFADVNLNGNRKRISVGDAVPVQGDGVNCTVFYKQSQPRPDGRVGFDLNCS